MEGHPEKILCVPAEKLFEKGKWQGIKKSDLDYYLELMLENQQFKVRDELETDPNYKQVIAQVILMHGSRYFLHEQVDRAEDRLNGLCPLPLGGHIEEFDQGEEKDVIEVGLLRELHEEVELNANIIGKKFLGLIYLEDENPVNSVHVGLVYLFEVDGEDIHIKEKGLRDIGFVNKQYLFGNKEKLTYWSRLIIDELE